MTETQQFTLIESKEGIEQFLNENQGIKWLAFDTEFVGEKRFTTLLCLIQIATENGLYLIDTIKLKTYQPFLDMIVDPSILKITHAGDNDYRLLNTLFDIIPQNIFDTQIAAGFVGYRYPISFRKLVEKEIKVRLNKGYSVTDWEARPLKPKQLTYALNDVIYLYELYEKLTRKIERFDRMKWVNEEVSIFENAPYYVENPYKQALESKLIKQLKPHEQVFLLRLYKWRRDQAERQNLSKEMILPSKLMGVIIRNINSGKTALLDNRIISNRIVEKYWNTFNSLYQKKITDDERERISDIPPDIDENPQEELTSELLFLIIKKKCLDNDIAPSLLISKNVLKRLRNDPHFTSHGLDKNWKTDLLGKDLIAWVNSKGNLKMEMKDGVLMIKGF